MSQDVVEVCKEICAAERCFSTHDWKEKKEKHKNLEEFGTIR